MRCITLLPVFALLLLVACTSPNGSPEERNTADRHAVGDTAGDFQVKHVIKFPALQEYIASGSDDKVKVINFWATWCKPCIKELPFIDSLRYTYGPDKVEVLLVNLDFPDELSKVNAFILRKKIESTVWLLDESDPNLFIDQVDPSWSGAIPATLLIRNSTTKRIFLEGELTKSELEKQINTLLK